MNNMTEKELKESGYNDEDIPLVLETLYFLQKAINSFSLLSKQNKATTLFVSFSGIGQPVDNPDAISVWRRVHREGNRIADNVINASFIKDQDNCEPAAFNRYIEYFKDIVFMNALPADQLEIQLRSRIQEFIIAIDADKNGGFEGIGGIEGVIKGIVSGFITKKYEQQKQAFFKAAHDSL